MRVFYPFFTRGLIPLLISHFKYRSIWAEVVDHNVTARALLLAIGILLIAYEIVMLPCWWLQYIINCFVWCLKSPPALWDFWPIRATYYEWITQWTSSNDWQILFVIVSAYLLQCRIKVWRGIIRLQTCIDPLRVWIEAYPGTVPYVYLSIESGYQQAGL